MDVVKDAVGPSLACRLSTWQCRGPAWELEDCGPAGDAKDRQLRQYYSRLRLFADLLTCAGCSSMPVPLSLKPLRLVAAVISALQVFGSQFDKASSLAGSTNAVESASVYVTTFFESERSKK